MARRQTRQTKQTRTPSTTPQPSSLGVTVGIGAVFGVVAYLFGYLVTFILWTLDGRATTGIAYDRGGSTDFVGWIFYGAHNTATKLVVTSGGQSEQIFNSNILAVASTGVPKLTYYLVPVIALVGAGFLLATVSQPQGGVDAIAAAPTIVVGYLPMVVIGTFLFTRTGTAGPDSTGSVSPVFLQAVGFAGFLYPLILGAVGGALYAALK